MSEKLNINMIFKGEVTGIKPFGAFVSIPGCNKNGLVHVSQLSKCRVENVSEILQVSEKVWCKIISIDDDQSKIGLSMKFVDQGSGKDLDPNGVQQSQDDKKKKIYVPQQATKITLEAVLNTTCKKCGTKGHLAQDCFQVPGGKVYELISETEEANVKTELPEDTDPQTETVHKKRKKHKESKPKKHHKAHKHKHKSHKHS